MGYHLSLQSFQKKFKLSTFFLISAEAKEKGTLKPLCYGLGTICPDMALYIPLFKFFVENAAIVKGKYKYTNYICVYYNKLKLPTYV